MSTLTDQIQAAETIIEAMVRQLQGNNAGLGVYKYSGTSYQSLFEFLPVVQCPAAVVVWQGAALNREPGRPQRCYHDITVLVMAQDADGEQGAEAARVQAWEIMRLLDDWQTGDATCRVLDIAAVDLSSETQASTVACYSVACEVGDH